MVLRLPAGAALVALLLVLSVPVPAQYASYVAAFNQGAGGGIFVTSNILGGPTGLGFISGSLDVLTLGEGGSVTLGFGSPIRDGQGVDFTVFENGFEYPSQWVFSEVAYVEVSTNGLDFVRFPSRYLGPATSLPAFGTLPMGSYAGLAGSLPVLANVVTGIGLPLNPVFSGGDAFDLEDLAFEPLVLSGQVDLQNVNFVRLVDVVAGLDQDSGGTVIEDSHNGSGADGADFDAVAVLNSAANAAPGQPRVSFTVDALGYLILRFEDPNGIGDLDPLSFMGSFNLRNFGPQELDLYYEVWSLDALGIDFRTRFPVVGTGLHGVAGVGIADLSGQVSYDQFVLPG
ncbi:MAG: hypothetical protein H6807_10710 [Planctomycetes bacterium]|nr:hypothetical protein [Planctomycetota bacterium]